MALDDAPPHRSQVFTVRIWTDGSHAQAERRGHVRDVASGAFCNFREWSGLTSFLEARMEESIGLVEAADETGGGT